MRKYIPHLLYPLLPVTVMLMIGIVAAYCFNAFLPTLFWLLLSVWLFGIALIRKHPSEQSILIHLLAFALGGTLSAHQLDTQSMPAVSCTYSELSTLDKVRLQANEFRQRIEGQYQQLDIQQSGYAIVTAMTVGDKQFLDKDTKEIYSQTGASHILAVSGLHVGIIFQLFVLLLGGRRRSAVTITLAITSIWAYTLMIGFPASAIRASIMISIYCFVVLLHRNPLSINGLMLAAFIMLCFNPQNLFDISFQMSFLAVLFILLLYNRLYNLLPQNLCSNHPLFGKLLRWIWGMTILSFAAQLGTTPIIVFYFGRISCFSLLTNFIAIPAATLIIYLSAIFLASSLYPPLQNIIGDVLSLVAHASNKSLAWFANLPGAYIDQVSINLLQLGLIYVAIGAGCYILLKKQ